MSGNPRFRVLYVFWAFLECLLFGGLLFGWGSFVVVLKKDGVFADLCTVLGQEDGDEKEEAEAAEDTCLAQDERLVLVFAVASGLFCAGAAVIGRINYRFGTRVTRLCSLMTFVAGSLLTGFTSKEIPWLILPGMVLLGIGGIALLITNSQLSVLFPVRGASVMGILNGAFDTSSGLVPLLIKLLHERGVALRWSMLTLCGVHFLTLISTFCFLPATFISISSSPEVDDNKPADTSDAGQGTDVMKPIVSEDGGQAPNSSQEPPAASTAAESLPSLRSCLLSPMFLLHTLWFCLLQLRFYYFLGSVNTWLHDVLSSQQQVSKFINILLYTMMSSMFISPLVGLLYDVCKRQFAARDSKLWRELMPAVLPLTLTCFIGMLLSALALFQVQAVLYMSFIVLTLFRAFIYSIGTAFLLARFPSEYLGLLYGVMLVTGGAVAPFQYALYAWVEVSGHTMVNGFLIGAMTVPLIHPLYLWWTCRRAARRGDRQSPSGFHPHVQQELKEMQ